MSRGHIKVRATQRTGGESHLVAGTVFGRDPRITRIDECYLDLPPRGFLLLTRHKDQPGVLGQLGTLLGKHEINIRRLELGPPKHDERGLAYGFLTLEARPNPAVLSEIQELEAVEEVQLLHL